MAQIPAQPASGAAEPSPGSGQTGRKSAAAKQGGPVKTADGKIAFSCSQCGHSVRVPASFAGKKGKCPICQAVMQIPQVSADRTAAPKTPPAARRPASPAAGKQAAPTGKQAPAGKRAAAGKAAGGGQPISFPCPHCQRQVKTPAAAAGKKGKCPHCSAVIQIPRSSTTGTATPDIVEAAPDELTELPSEPAAQDFGGLQPLPDMNDPFGAPAPAGGGAAGDDPLGLGGLGGGDPFADLGQAGPQGAPYAGWSAGQAAANPYATPSPAAATTSRRKSFSGGKRKGLPWDREEEGGFFSTVKLALGSPNDAFSRMRISGGVGRPLYFAILGSLFGNMLTTLYWLIFLGVFTVVILNNAPPDVDQGQIMGAMGLQAGQLVLNGLIYSTVGTAMGTFVSAGVLHLLLMMFGGTNGPYETTYRAVAYTMGSASCLLAIPLCGFIVVAIAYPIYMIFALARAHETDGWRAACAVFFPYVLCCAVGIFVIFSVFAVIAAAAGSG